MEVTTAEEKKGNSRGQNTFGFGVALDTATVRR